MKRRRPHQILCRRDADAMRAPFLGRAARRDCVLLNGGIVVTFNTLNNKFDFAFRGAQDD